jgi:hypothetical protein
MSSRTIQAQEVIVVNGGGNIQRLPRCQSDTMRHPEM